MSFVCRIVKVPVFVGRTPLGERPLDIAGPAQPPPSTVTRHAAHSGRSGAPRRCACENRLSPRGLRSCWSNRTSRVGRRAVRVLKLEDAALRRSSPPRGPSAGGVTGAACTARRECERTSRRTQGDLAPPSALRPTEPTRTRAVQQMRAADGPDHATSATTPRVWTECGASEESRS